MREVLISLMLLGAMGCTQVDTITITCRDGRVQTVTTFGFFFPQGTVAVLEKLRQNCERREP